MGYNPLSSYFRVRTLVFFFTFKFNTEPVSGHPERRLPNCRRLASDPRKPSHGSSELGPRAATEPPQGQGANVAGLRHRGDTGGHRVLPSVQTRSGNRHHPFLQRQTSRQKRLHWAAAGPGCVGSCPPTTPPQSCGPCLGSLLRRGHYPPAAALRPARRSDALLPQKHRLLMVTGPQGLRPQINMGWAKLQTQRKHWPEVRLPAPLGPQVPHTFQLRCKYE